MSDLGIDVNSKQFAARVARMIAAKLIGYRQYYGWADQWIGALESPPVWLLELATIRNSDEAVAAIGRFVLSEPFESFDHDQDVDEFIACLLLKYERGNRDWSGFLSRAGAHVDHYGGRRGCEYFYGFLNEFEEANCSLELELRQQRQVRQDFERVLSEIEPLFAVLNDYPLGKELDDGSDSIS